MCQQRDRSSLEHRLNIYYWSRLEYYIVQLLINLAMGVACYTFLDYYFTNFLFFYLLLLFLTQGLRVDNVCKSLPKTSLV